MPNWVTPTEWTPKHHGRTNFAMFLTKPLGQIYEATAGSGAFINLTCSEKVEDGDHVAFDRGSTVCNKIKVEDFGRLGGVAFVDAEPGQPIMVACREVITFMVQNGFDWHVKP